MAADPNSADWVCRGYDGEGCPYRVGVNDHHWELLGTIDPTPQTGLIVSSDVLHGTGITDWHPWDAHPWQRGVTATVTLTPDLRQALRAMGQPPADE
jgi:hypothetical protein